MNSCTAPRSATTVARADTGRPQRLEHLVPVRLRLDGEALPSTHAVDRQPQPAHVRPHPLDLGRQAGHSCLRALDHPGRGSSGPPDSSAAEPAASSSSRRSIRCRKRPGRRVARVGERRAAERQLLVVDPLEVRDREVDLTADLHQRRHPPTRRGRQPGRDRRDEPCVVGHVLPHSTVPTRGHRHQPPAAVHDVHRQTVDLQLAEHWRELPHRTLHPVGPGRRARRR